MRTHSLSSKTCLSLLSLQPFFGGSHKAFISGWVCNSRHNWHEINLPARHWKWRMRHSAIEFSKRVDQFWREGKRWGAIFTTDMCNVAEFKGLLKTNARHLPVIVYFHENQLVYPKQKPDERDFHFAFSNLTTALAADSVWYNSAYNRQSMADELKFLAKKWPDFIPNVEIATLVTKGVIQPPGIDTPEIATARFGSEIGDAKENLGKQSTAIHIVWAGRWEHDKNPRGLLEILRQLLASGIDFRLSVVGESFRGQPEEFQTIREEFSKQIVDWGFQETRAEYWNVLMSADVLLSTANHEFFGLSVMEGLSAGLVALLPNRLVYPEIDGKLRDKKCELVRLYESEADAVEVVRGLSSELDSIRDPGNRRNQSNIISEMFGWHVRAHEMDDLVVSIATSNS